jgi:Mrp family chromosome partitioning ATPase
VDSPGQEKSQTIKLAGRDGETGGEVELLNPDFVAKAKSIEQAGEKIAEFETEKKTGPADKDYPVIALRCDSLEQYYQKLTGVMQSIPYQKGQAILLTSPADTPLGINTAVNAAIGLVGTGLKVLLIDVEPHRCAAAKAFDLEASKTLSGPQKTCIDNLQIFTAGNTENQAIQRTGLAMDKLHEQFDRILIYGPQRMQILAGKLASRFHAIIFVKPRQGSVSIPLAPTTANYASIIVLPGADAAMIPS